MIKYNKITFDVGKYFPKLIEAFSKEKYISAVYLFGSYGRGSISPLSDVDIAVLINIKTAGSQDFINLRCKLLSISARILKTEEIDLVILNIIPVYLQYRIIKDGKLLFVRDDSLEREFRENVVSLYLDTKKIRDEYFDYLEKSFLHEGVGNGYQSRKYQFALKRAQGLYR